MTPPLALRGMPTTGTVKVFALLIAFSDYPPVTSAEVINQKLFGPENTTDPAYPYESLRAYYQRSSYNKLDIQGDVLGWYVASYPRSTVMETTEGRENLIKEALDYFVSQGHDFSQYDSNNDGIIDYFLVFWTGPRGEWASFWWGYQPDFSDTSYTVSGKRLLKYSWQWELDNYPSAQFSPVVAIHETGHALGLPDYFDYDDTVGPSNGVGGFDMMDSNNFDHNCFSKFLLDWLTPEFFNSGSRMITLKASGSDAEAFMFTPAFSPDAPFDLMFSEYFMVQNRYAVKNDARLASINNGDVGLAVWHVEAKLNSSGTNFLYDNSFTEYKLLKLVQADGLDEIEQYNSWFDAEDFFRVGKEFGPDTNPSTSFNNGDPTHMGIKDIQVQEYGQIYTFLAYSIIPDIRVPLTAIDFGNVSLGTSVDQSATLYNDGGGYLIIYNISRVSGSNDFLYITPAVPFSIPPGDSKEITIRFNVNNAGPSSASFLIETNDPDSRQVILEVKGNSIVGPKLTIPVSSLDFGEVTIGSYKDQTITISNAGQIALTIDSIANISGSNDFSYLGPTTPFTILPNGSMNITFRFNPSREGVQSSSFQIKSNDIDNPQIIFGVSGTGVLAPRIRLGTSLLDFGNVNLCTQVDKTLMIYNDGNAPLIINNIAHTSGSNDFSYVSPSLPISIPAGSSKEITIRFSPHIKGSLSAMFSVVSNDPTTPQASFNVNGTGFVPEITFRIIAEKKVERSWIIKRGYTVVTIEVNKSAPFNVSLYRLYRAEEGSSGNPVVVKTFLETDFQYGRVVYVDKYVEINKNYIYSVDAIDCNGQVIAPSSKIIKNDINNPIKERKNFKLTMKRGENERF